MRKQIFYLSKDQLLAYQWQGGQLAPGPAFANDGAGLAGFAAYLAARQDIPASLVADVVEEDFQRQLLPAVGGRGGRAMVARRLGQLYRDTPYRHAAIQGREAQGRRDMLFCALTNPGEVQPWVQLLEQQQVALTGMYSSALLSGALLLQLAPRHTHQLLVTQQSGGLRQSYFHDGYLKFSRLTQAIDGAGASASLAMEIARTRQFLTSTHLLERGDVLHAVVPGPAAPLATLAGTDGAGLVYHFIDLDSAAARLGVAMAAPAADHLLLTLLARKAPPSHYALGRQARFYHLWLARHCLNAGSCALLVCCLAWLAANQWGIHAAAGASATLALETGALEQRQRSSMASLPPAVARSENMKAAVLIEHLMATQGPLPGPMLAMLSRALEQAPQVELTQLNWQVALPGGALPGSALPGSALPGSALPGGAATGGTTAGGAATGAAFTGVPQPPREGAGGAAPSSLLIGVPTQAPQILRLDAQVRAGQDDARAGIDSMRQFTRELARNPQLQVQIAQPTLDVRPSVKLAGRAGTAGGDTRAGFSLILVWTP